MSRPLCWRRHARLAACCAFLMAASAHAWADDPSACPHVAAETGTDRNVVIRPHGIELAVLRAVAPDGTAQPVGLSGESARLSVEGGNHHLIFAEGLADGARVIAATAIHIDAPGPTPAAILTAARTGLTLLPQRLPPKGERFSAGERLSLNLRANGQPIGGQPVLLQTSAGTTSTLTSDLDGVVTLTLPDDLAPGLPDDAPAHFLVCARLATAAQPKLASFYYAYGPKPHAPAMLWPGLGAALAAILALAWVWRRGQRR